MRDQLHKLLDLVLDAKEKGIDATITFSQHVDLVNVRFIELPLCNAHFDMESYYGGKLLGYRNDYGRNNCIPLEELVKKTEEYIKSK